MGEKKDKKKPKAEKSDKKSDNAKKDKKKKKKEVELTVKWKREKKDDKKDKKKDKKEEKVEKKEKKDHGDKKKPAKKDKKDKKVKVDKKDDGKKAKSSPDTKDSSKKDPVLTVCCICKDVNASAGGLCKHDFCVPCLEGLLHKTKEDKTLGDNHLSAPTLGRCPECNTELRKFEIKDTSTQKLKYKRSTDIAKSPLHGKTFHPLDKTVQFGSFHFDGDPQPYMNFKAAIKSDKDTWIMNDGAKVEKRKFFEEGCHFDATTRTFHGTIKWHPVTFLGAHQWDVVLGFNKKFTAIHIGLIHERKERVLEEEEKSKVPKWELSRYLYPLDGEWKSSWVNSAGDEQKDSLTVTNNEFQQGPYLFNLNFDEREKPRFRWPSDPVFAAAKSGFNLNENPMGPFVGERIVWETTHADFGQMTWKRESIGETPGQSTIHFGVGSNEYSIAGAGE
jgi:hypothetical protein